MANQENGTLFAAAAVLFVLTLVAGTVPVHLIEYISKRLNNKSKEINSQNQSACSVSGTNQTQTVSSSFCSRLKNILTKDRIVQFLAQFGGGVLLYTSLIHMLPEIRENYEHYLNNKNGNTSNDLNEMENHEEDSSLPLVDFCACAGFFGIFLIEELMHSIFLKNYHHHHHSDLVQNRQVNFNKNNSLTRHLTMRQYIKTRKNYYPHIDEIEDSVRGKVGQEDRIKPEPDIVLSETHPISACQPTFKYDACDQVDIAIDSNGKRTKIHYHDHSEQSTNRPN